MPTISLDTTPEARHRRAAEVESRMASSTAAGAARNAERRRVEAAVEAEELDLARAAAARAEADQERARIREIWRLGHWRGKGSQAVRLALSAPLASKAAESLLDQLPSDADASPEALTMPGAISFGTSAAKAEAERIRAAFAHPAARGRGAAVAAFVLQTDAGMTADQIAPLLATLPSDADRPRTPSIAERAEGLAEFGGSGTPMPSRREEVRQGWRKAAQQANASIGATLPASPVGGQPGPTAPAHSHPDHPHFGLTDAARAAAEAAEKART